MRRVAFSIVAAVAGIGCASCEPPHPHDHAREASLHKVSALDCPAEQGDLELKSGASGGERCVYETDAGGQVTLELVNLGAGDAKAALGGLESGLRAETPAAGAVPATPASPTDADDAPGADGDHHDRVDLDLPGLHIHTHGDGRADVDTAGVHVHAKDQDGAGGGQAQVNIGAGVHIDAHDGGAQIRIAEPGSGIRLSYVLESDTPGPHGYRVAAYEARGPDAGPLVVARILGKDKDSDDLRHDAHELVKLNAGG
jgi:hypothetical protein